MKIQDMNNKSEGWRPSRAELSDFLRAQPLCTLSTVDAVGQPQGATVAFSETQDGDFIVGTSDTSRKAANIDTNPHVAMTITDAERRYTVQLEGTARKLGAEAFAAYADYHYDQLPASRPFRDAPGQVNILVSPTHIRFSDCNPHPWVLTDFSSEGRASLLD